MKRLLIPGKSDGFFPCKTNLHCHTTLSDGRFTPEEIKKAYRERGYGAVAFTDHNLFIRHNDLTDEAFVALNGIEYNVNDESEEGRRIQRCCHMNLIALSPETRYVPCAHRSLYFSEKALKNAGKMEFDPAQPDFIRSYDPETLSEMMEEGRRAGFFVTYNHPAWSRETYPQYSRYHGMHALEIYNHHNAVLGFPEENERVYEDLLSLGKRIFCIAADDTHSKWTEPGDPLSDCFGGFTTLYVRNLTYEDLADALRNGVFCCGTGDHRGHGAEILSLAWENGEITLCCRGALTASVQTDVRFAKTAFLDPEKESVVRFIPKESARFFRLTLTDPRGFKTFTRAYFTDEL